MPAEIVMPNPKQLEETIARMKQDGPDKLHILADFDRTLAYASVKGEKTPSFMAVLRDGTYLSPEYANQSKALFDYYHPLEVDPTISRTEKKQLMEEWYGKHFDLLKQYGLSRQDIERLVQSEKLQLRANSADFFQLLHQHHVPLIIMSGSGLGGDAISLYLKQRHRLISEIHIISNNLIWNEEGKMIGVKKPFIHPLNKDETILKDFPFYPTIKERKNVILLGDDLHDVEMIEGFDYDNLIKIGFLNERWEELLPAYKQNYDLIILGDQGMEKVNEILEQVIG